MHLKTWLQKRGVKTQCDIVEVWDTAAKILKERNADANGTPGRGLFGKAVVNMLTGFYIIIIVIIFRFIKVLFQIITNHETTPIGYGNKITMEQ